MKPPVKVTEGDPVPPCTLTPETAFEDDETVMETPSHETDPTEELDPRVTSTPSIGFMPDETLTVRLDRESAPDPLWTIAASVVVPATFTEAVPATRPREPVETTERFDAPAFVMEFTSWPARSSVTDEPRVPPENATSPASPARRTVSPFVAAASAWFTDE